MTKSFILLVLSVVTALLLLKPIRCQRRLGNPCDGAGEIETTTVRHTYSLANRLVTVEIVTPALTGIAFCIGPLWDSVVVGIGEDHIRSFYYKMMDEILYIYKILYAYIYQVMMGQT